MKLLPASKTKLFVLLCKVIVIMPKPSEKTNKKVTEIVSKLHDDKFYNEFLEMAKGIPIFFSTT